MKTLAHQEIKGPLSLLLRLSLSEPIEEIASKHKQVIHTSGRVWLGVFGATLARPTLDILKSRGEYLYIVQMGRRDTIGYKGVISGIAQFLSASEARLVPRYYKEKALTPLVKFWVQLSALTSVDIDELDKLRVARTGTRVLDLFRSMTSLAAIMKDDTSEIQIP